MNDIELTNAAHADPDVRGLRLSSTRGGRESTLLCGDGGGGSASGSRRKPEEACNRTSSQIEYRSGFKFALKSRFFSTTKRGLR